MKSQIRSFALAALLIPAAALLVSGVACVGSEPTVSSSGDASAGMDGRTQDTGSGGDTGVLGDAGSDGGTDADAATSACDRTKPFGAPGTIATPATLGNVGTWSLTTDELQIFFSQLVPDGGASWDIYGATRTQASDPFGMATLAPALSTVAVDVEPAISGDGLTLVVANLTNGGNNYDLFYASRSARGAAWGTLTQVANVNSPQNDRYASFRGDGKELLFASARPSNGTYDIYSAPISLGSFGTASAVSELNTTGEEQSPVVTEDGLLIFWSSDRSPSTGSLDIWYATRASTSDVFGGFRNVSELNTGADDRVLGVSPDGCRVYFGGSGGVLKYADRAL